ncbi:MAG TPA: ribose 5-phosphate isomerase B [Planctomycetota bacterium]|nr:ribose 5-phosphate isomerase B [Planctomycetota bacterium]
MKVIVGSDHAGFAAKQALVAALKKMGHSVTDAGTDGPDSVDYPDFAVQVGRAVADAEAERGILICGTGIGMAMAANKIPGVRAAVVTNEFTAEVSRRHNDANVLAMGARVQTPEKMEELARIFLESPFDGGRHAGRVDKINKLDHKTTTDDSDEG